MPAKMWMQACSCCAQQWRTVGNCTIESSRVDWNRYDIVEAHCYFVDIGQTDREQIRNRINNNDCRTFWPQRPLSTAYRTVQRPLWPKRSAIIVIDSVTYLLTISSPDMEQIYIHTYIYIHKCGLTTHHDYLPCLSAWQLQLFHLMCTKKTPLETTPCLTLSPLKVIGLKLMSSNSLHFVTLECWLTPIKEPMWIQHNTQSNL